MSSSKGKPAQKVKPPEPKLKEPVVGSKAKPQEVEKVRPAVGLKAELRP